jgi:hypothetical protein
VETEMVVMEMVVVVEVVVVVGADSRVLSEALAAIAVYDYRKLSQITCRPKPASKN